MKRFWAALREACTPHWSSSSATGLATGALLGSALNRPAAGLGIAASLSAASNDLEQHEDEKEKHQ